MVKNSGIDKVKNSFIERYYIIFLILSIIIVFIFTFHNPDPDYGVGLDASYVWGYNMLFAENYDALLDFVYPLGPLFVLKTPTTQSYNLIIYLIFYTVLKLSFLFLFFRTAKQNKVNFIATVLLSFIASFYITVDYLILFTCALLCMMYLRQRNGLFLILSSCLAALGLCIKSSIGISSFAVIGISWIVYLYMYRNFRQSAVQLLCIILPSIIICCCVFKGFSSFIYYINGMLHLVSGYGSTLALYPNNNWFIVAIGILAFVIYPFLKRDIRLSVFFLIMIIPFFSVFKHAFIREDIWHYQQLIYFLITFWTIAIIIEDKLKIVGIFFSIVSIGCFIFNARNLDYFSHLKPDLHSFEYFTKYYFNYNKTKKYYDNLNKQSLQADILPMHLVDKIDKFAVDCYPWEHLYVKANNLYWQPRKTIELGASTSAWCSSLASENYNKIKGVDFVIWHLLQEDRTKSIDDRYFLNDEPLVVQSLLSNYDIIDTATNCMLLKRNPSKQSLNSVRQSDVFIKCLNEWIDVPHNDALVMRTKIFSDYTLKGKIKSILLKDVAFFIDYKTKNGQIYSYRYQPFAATQGLWTNPLVLFNENEIFLSEISQIRIRTNNNKYVKDSIQIRWEWLQR